MKGISRRFLPLLGLCCIASYADATNVYNQDATITSPVLVSSGFFAATLSLSSDGNTALISENGAGKAFVFTRSGNSWSKAFELDDPGTGTSDFFGESLALSGDGKTAVVCSDIAAYIYTTSGGGWSLMKVLSDPGTSPSTDYFCQAEKPVALSEDGTTLIIGADSTTVSGVGTAGVAYVYTSAGGTWSAPAAITEPSGPVSGDGFGHGVDLSADGKTILVGGFLSETAYLFTLQSGSWALSHTFNNPDHSSTGTDNLFGLLVALSGDATRAVIAAPFSSSGGTAYIYTKSQGTWNNPLPFHDATHTSGHFAESMALSSNGNAAFFVEQFSGRAFYTHFSNGVWSRLTEITDQLPQDDFHAVSLTSDGSRVLIGSAATDINGFTKAGQADEFTYGAQNTGGGTGTGATTSGGGGCIPLFALTSLAWFLIRRRRAWVGRAAPAP
jgi:hypothetical protein